MRRMFATALFTVLIGYWFLPVSVHAQGDPCIVACETPAY